ncbi:glycosyltransferase [Rhizobacter sp. J219]|uniref:glycosyltransferase family 2 protein n=1 Tax=Rhizobacter sp. J219 TaxID=2898430 RepID=UPI002150F9D1|nr:glycosyltransferase [Rhizobacter sp. J219]MCR5883024.1 glycosyltransferase [Rhizobacter sp. J219]
MPFVSVVIPAKNAEATLPETLESLCAQSFRDFEVVLVNDGSTDGTAAVAAAFAERLSLRVVTHEASKGVAESINDGLRAGDSEFVARLDADDLAAPQRLERQLSFLRSRPGVDVCGSHMQIFSVEDGQRVDRHVLAHPTESAEIRTALLQRCAISHPSVLCRRSTFERFGFYDPRFDFAEDYELWCRASLLGAQFANLPEVLTHYRKHAGQVSSQKAQLQYERDIAIKARYMAAMLQGENPGLLPQFIALQTQFRSRDIALTVLQQCGPAMTRLARAVPHSDEYARIVTGSLMRHLR